MNQAWEYRLDQYPANSSPAATGLQSAMNIQALLNQRGGEGWELAGMYSNFICFKRSK